MSDRNAMDEPWSFVYGGMSDHCLCWWYEAADSVTGNSYVLLIPHHVDQPLTVPIAEDLGNDAGFRDTARSIEQVGPEHRVTYPIGHDLIPEVSVYRKT